MSRLNDLDALQHRVTLKKPVNDETVKCINCSHAVWDYDGVVCLNPLNDKIILHDYLIYSVDLLILSGLDKEIEFQESEDGEIAVYCSEFEPFE